MYEAFLEEADRRSIKDVGDRPTNEAKPQEETT
jgi:hypothetical protein